MIVVLKRNSPADKVQQFINKMKKDGFGIHESHGEDITVLGLLGDTSKLDCETIRANEVVDSVKRVTAPYKMANRAFHPDDTLIKIGDKSKGEIESVFGGKEIPVMAGPCSIENEAQLRGIAEAVKKSGARMLRGGAFKPRTSPYSFQGLGAKGIELMIKAKQITGLPLVTELMDVRQIPYFEHIDLIQIGARNMQNFDLLKEVGKLHKPILLKRGLAATVTEFLMSAEYIMASGNEQVILCERGIRTFDTYTRNCLDISVVPYLKKVSHLPVIIDPSHACGKRWMVPTLAKAAIAAGADGLMIEVHNNPEKALSDGEQSLTPMQFDKMMNTLTSYAAVEKRSL